MDFLHAIILGIIEGVTEFLPISSTGHMILASKLMGLSQSDFLKTFEISIQLGSILAVLILFWHKLTHHFSIWIKLFIGFIPTGILGLTLYEKIKTFFDPTTVAYMLIFGGFAFLIVEYFYKPQSKLEHISQISYKKAFLIGLFQSLAMIPGTSRSGATIIGGLLFGLSRKCSAEFSFLLALPTILSATLYDLYKNSNILTTDHLQILVLGTFVAFITALCVIKIFLNFISRFSYRFFGIYRIILGLIFLFALQFWL